MPTSMFLITVNGSSKEVSLYAFFSSDVNFAVFRVLFFRAEVLSLALEGFVGIVGEKVSQRASCIMFG